MSAGMKVKLEIIGFPELKRQFKRLSEQMQGEGLQRAAMAGGQVVEQYAKINANSVFSGRATNNLGNSIHTVIGESSTTYAEAEVGTNVVYARIHELGGIIKPVFARMLHWVTESGEHIFAKVVHIPARPYLRPAIDEHMNEIREAVSYEIRRTIESAQ
jgi:phage gpG-like protein